MKNDEAARTHTSWACNACNDSTQRENTAMERSEIAGHERASAGIDICEKPNSRYIRREFDTVP